MILQMLLNHILVEKVLHGYLRVEYHKDTNHTNPKVFFIYRQDQSNFPIQKKIYTPVSPINLEYIPKLFFTRMTIFFGKPDAFEIY